MITPRTMSDFVFAEPFRPFRIHMASGRAFEIGHPEMISVGRSSVTIYGKTPDNGAEVDRWQKVSLMLVESIEPFELRAPVGNN